MKIKDTAFVYEGSVVRSTMNARHIRTLSEEAKIKRTHKQALGLKMRLEKRSPEQKDNN